MERYISSWPDSFEERDYNILEPAEAFLDTDSYLKSRGFAELRRSSTFSFMLPVNRPLIDPKTHEPFEHQPERLYITISANGLVLLGYNPDFVSRIERYFSPHSNPHHMQISVCGSTRALDEVVR